MDAKTGIAIGLVVFILAALVFLKIRAKKKERPGAAEKPPPFYITKRKGVMDKYEAKNLSNQFRQG